MPFKTAKPYEDLRVTEGDMLIASLAFGWTLGFGYFVVCHAVRETRRTRRANVYVVLIWSQIAVINIWWDRIEKCLYLVVDGMLNYFFIRSVKQRLVNHGVGSLSVDVGRPDDAEIYLIWQLKKYDKLVRYNIRIVGVSLAMDVLIIGMMSLRNDFVYMQFHSVAYTVKLNIEMSMSQLIIKVARSTGIQVFELEDSIVIVDTSKESRSRPVSGGRSEHIRTEVHIDRHVFTQDDGRDDMEMQPKHWMAVKIKSQASDDAIIDKKVGDGHGHGGPVASPKSRRVTVTMAAVANRIP
ncbi:hypothetical protein B0H10DRAFT_2184956 [Mycena sp. CBHHK59/15]|nr:hypothetical protein B0H10DRAFT_2184956 [Mycena sp. CBHHK59/15]